MKKTSVTASAFVVGLLGMLPARIAMAGGVVGNGSPNTCTEGALDAALAGGGSLTFNCGTRPFTINVTATKTITADTSIDGAGLLTLDGKGSVQIVSVHSGVALTVNGVTFKRGIRTIPDFYGGAGAINSEGPLTLTNCTFSDNAVNGAITHCVFEGCGTDLGAPLNVSNSTFSGNTSDGGGGAIDALGPVVVSDSTFSGNTSGEGGAISNLGSLTVTNSRFFDNSSPYDGGAIYTASGITTITDSTFSNNIADEGGAIIIEDSSTTFTNCIFQGNVAGQFGGGAIRIYETTSIAVRNSTFTNNIAQGDCYYGGGGAININYSDQGVTVTDSTFSGNRTDCDGGAISVSESQLVVTTSAFSHNRARQSGGAIVSGPNSGSQLSVADCVFSGNRVTATAQGFGNGGGAIYVDPRLPTVVTRSTFSHNRVSHGRGGAVFSTGYGLGVVDSTFSRNLVTGSSADDVSRNGGAAIFSDAEVAIANSTFSTNSARYGKGGAMYVDGLLTVANSTFAGNKVSHADGGAVHALNGGTIVNSTFSRNGVSRGGRGGAIFRAPVPPGGDDLILENTIVADSRGGNCSGSITDGGHNLRWPAQDTSCAGYVADPKLSSLKSNGGPTQTLALRSGSAAINAGDNAICAITATTCTITACDSSCFNAPPYSCGTVPAVNNLDQRGFVRPGGGVTNCSIGAYEYNATAP